MAELTLKKGMIFHGSYGYNCTFNEFWEVIEVKGKKTAILKELKTQRINYKEEMPIIGKYKNEKTITKRLTKNNNFNLNDVIYLDLWDNKSKYKSEY